MADESHQREELARTQAAIQAQEASRDIIPDEQLNHILASLLEKQQAILAQLAGSGAIAQGEGVRAAVLFCAQGKEPDGYVVCAIEQCLLAASRCLSAVCAQGVCGEVEAGPDCSETRILVSVFPPEMPPPSNYA